MQPYGEITGFLIQWGKGDSAALDEMMPLVYDELRRLAASCLRRERRDHTLEPTALVHEAYLRLVDQRSADWKGLAQFYGIAARVMRNILVDHARKHTAAKRGGMTIRLSLSEADRFDSEADVELISLDLALKELEAIKPQHSRVIELRFFGGLSIAETAAVLGISHATVERDWTFARAWLRREIARN